MVHAPKSFLAACMAAFLLAGCAASVGTERLDALLPADVVLLGEQHDAPQHQQIHAQVVQQLAARGLLAALVLEMADAGRSTDGLPPDADAARVREALQWNDSAWPWDAYGPAVLAAVRAGVPVHGANVPRSGFRAAMQDAGLDGRVPPAALQALQAAIRTGHCDLLPAEQVAPMARIQIARDRSMARAVQALARPAQVVVLLAGSGHVDRSLGVPQHLPSSLRARSVRLLAGDGVTALPGFDAVWQTPPVQARDHCADLRRQLGR